ncbi:lysosome membrane protein 2 [Folsomia candida]|nr:lysosome membrane protein 2 [Folsomia candida]
MNNGLKIAILVSALGALVVIVASVLGFRVLPDVIKSRIEDEIALRPLSSTWDSWSDIDRPLYMNVYILNVTNPNTINTDGAPTYAQVGPYAFRQRRRKINLSQADGERLVTYEQKTYYFFDPEVSGSNLRETDEINILNLPFYGFIGAMYRETIGIPGFVDHIANNILPNEKLTRPITVGQLMFDGLNATYLIEAIRPNQTIPPADQIIFGLYLGTNGTSDNIAYKIHTGVGDSSVFGTIVTVNGSTDLGFWNPLSECDAVKGTDGSIFPPFVTKGRTVEIYSSDICRSLYLRYDKEEEVKGIKGYRFTVPKEALEDPRTNKDNMCYCSPQDQALNACLGAGTIDVSACKGSPFVMSTPFFLDGDEKYSAKTGLRPARDLHETALVIEPNSGALLKANKRIQLNFNFKQFPNTSINAFRNIENMIFPILWIDESMEFTDDNAEDLKDELLNPKKAIETWRWVVLGVGIGLILGGMGIYVWKG